MSKRRRDGQFKTDKLPQLLHGGGVSMVGLAKILAALQDETDVAVNTMRNQLLRENQSALSGMWCHVDVPCSTGGQPFRFGFVDPGKLLARILSDSPALQDLYLAAWNRSPASFERPWSIVIGFDEFIPGSKLSCDHSRKAMVLSFSFLQLGRAYLGRRAAWCTPLVLRSSKIAEVPANAF